VRHPLFLILYSYCMLYAFARFVLRLLFRVEVHGEMTRHDKLLVVANHPSFLDPALLAAFLPVRPVWMVHTTIASRWYVRPWLAFFPHVVADTTKPWSLKALAQMIEAGTPVLIFPEGRITVTGSLMKVYDGPAFLAAKTGAQVVVVNIAGAIFSKFTRMRRDWPRLWFPRIRLTIQPPTTIPMPEGRTPRIRRRIAAERLRRLLMESALRAQPERTLFEALLDAIAIHGRRRPMVEDAQMSQPQTYGEMLKSSLALGRIASKLAAEGDAVAVLMPNVAATVYLLFGLVAMRRVPAMLNYTAGLEGMQSACRAARARVVLTSRAFLERARLNAIVPRLQDVRVVYLEDLRPTFTLADKLWLIGWALWFPGLATRRANPRDPAVILFTSGSEGKPKGVVLSHAAILANAHQLEATVDFNSRDRMLAALPFFHSFGLTVGCVLPLVTGAPIFVYPSPLHYRIVPEMIYDRNCTVVFATNTFLANYGRFAHPYDFRRVRIVGAGAEKLTEDVRRLYSDKFGVRIIEGYGVTECSPVIAVNTPMANRTGTVGEIVPGMEWRLEPVAGIEEGGALHVRGPNLMLGYVREESGGVLERPRSSFGDGWHNTGDIVAIDADGFVTIQGRLRRFAKVAGEMVSLETTERIAVAASPNALHAAASRVDSGRGETIVLFTQDRDLAREHLQRAAREIGAPELALPRRIVHMESIPLLGNGKKDYVALARMAQEEAAGVKQG
jgi:acyl-[acyl-carrier-protein]-phospholipid O-acyltransferase / long-chain-fatty-acid--[acyl-carrier-protein] ligase